MGRMYCIFTRYVGFDSRWFLETKNPVLIYNVYYNTCGMIWQKTVETEGFEDKVKPKGFNAHQ